MGVGGGGCGGRGGGYQHGLTFEGYSFECGHFIHEVISRKLFLCGLFVIRTPWIHILVLLVPLRSLTATRSSAGTSSTRSAGTSS